MTPNFLVLGIDTPDFRWPRLWLPIFLLWIPVLVLAPFLFLVLLALCFVGRISVWRAIAVFWSILCSLPGTHVHVRADDANVLVRIL